MSFFKFAFPILAASFVLVVVTWPQIQPSVDRFRVGAVIREKVEANGPPIVNAQYLGLDQSGRPFSVTAKTVTKIDDDGVTMGLTDPEADITLSDGTWLALTAEQGLYDRHEETLDLIGAVYLFHDAGYQVRTNEATINFSLGTAFGTQPVSAQGPFGEIKSEGFEVIDKGNIIIFEGHSKMIVFPQSSRLKL